MRRFCRSRDALRTACAELELPLIANTQARGYNQNRIKGDYIIQLKGPYDVAVNTQPDGSFGLHADLWRGHVEQEVGKGYGKLLQLYGVHKASKEARRKGHMVRRTQRKDGTIKLTIAAS